MSDSIEDADLNRWDTEISAKTVKSKEEWEMRLKLTKNFWNRLPEEARDYWYQQRIEKYIAENTKLIRFTRKGKLIEKRKPVRWSKDEETFILKNRDLKPKQLYKIFPTNRTLTSITSKRYRLLRKNA